MAFLLAVVTLLARGRVSTSSELTWLSLLLLAVPRKVPWATTVVAPTAALDATLNRHHVFRAQPSEVDGREQSVEFFVLHGSSFADLFLATVSFEDVFAAVFCCQYAPFSGLTLDLFARDRVNHSQPHGVIPFARRP